MPMLPRSGGIEPPGSETTRPENAIVPRVTGSKPARQRSTVVLPHPDGPSRQPMPPRGEREVRPRTTRRAP